MHKQCGKYEISVSQFHPDGNYVIRSCNDTTVLALMGALTPVNIYGEFSLSRRSCKQRTGAALVLQRAVYCC